jgi:hypothetical protein
VIIYGRGGRRYRRDGEGDAGGAKRGARRSAAVLLAVDIEPLGETDDVDLDRDVGRVVLDDRYADLCTTFGIQRGGTWCQSAQGRSEKRVGRRTFRHGIDAHGARLDDASAAGRDHSCTRLPMSHGTTLLSAAVVWVVRYHRTARRGR